MSDLLSYLFHDLRIFHVNFAAIFLLSLVNLILFFVISSLVDLFTTYLNPMIRLSNFFQNFIFLFWEIISMFINCVSLVSKIRFYLSMILLIHFKMIFLSLFTEILLIVGRCQILTN